MTNSGNPTIQEALLTWYRQNARPLPWRETSEPYSIWLSEIMLQQTQVSTVLPYYERFLRRFPSIEALSKAEQGDVLKLWEGLGYYSRARNLHKAAKKIMDEHNGRFPDNLEMVQALPGIGRSTAGAIMTFAFGQPHPILDGNVKRVLARVEAWDKPTQATESQKKLWRVSESLLPDKPDSAYDFNQALMELGATLCSPRQPQCKPCPLNSFCQGYQRGLQNDLPVKAPRKTTPHYTIAVGMVWRDNRMLIALRPEEGLLGGLWEFPGGKVKEGESIEACVHREIMEETGLKVLVEDKIAQVRHAYTHFKITLHAFHCRYVSGNASPRASQELRWVTMDELKNYAFPKANNKILDVLKSNPPRQLTLC